MSKVILNEQYLKDIANAIRTRRGGTRTYYPGEMAWAIRHLDVPDTTVPSFASTTEDQLIEIVGRMDRGEITPEQTGWKVGDERIVHLSAMETGGFVGETHEEQDVTLVIMDSGHYELTNPTSSGRTVDHFVVGLKNCLGGTGYMNSTNTNAGSWENCNRRNWCNTVFRSAFPSKLQSIFKSFEVVTATEYNGTTVSTTNDYFALFAEKEIFGTRSYSNNYEANNLSQIAYYVNTNNRIKKLGDSGSASLWWGRSPDDGSSGAFCTVGSPGGASAHYAKYPFGLAPFGCI